MQKIKKETPISELLEKHPEVAEILMDYGLMCAGCRLAGNHGLKETKEMYGLSDMDIKEILKRINELIEKKK